MNRRSLLKKSGLALLVLFIVMNIVAYMHAYTFTHFSGKKTERTKDPKELTSVEKLRIVAAGIDNPKPSLKKSPERPYERIEINASQKMVCWRFTIPEPKGTIVLFHGYAGEKSSLLERSEEILKLGYNTLLVDFTGSGESEGNHTTIGFHEAEQVKACFDHVKKNGEDNIYLFGTSMGAAAILKAIDDYKITPEAILLECPFGSLYKTVCARFEIMNLPAFPMAGLLTFWGGVQHGYWAFGHNPASYAKAVTCRALLIFGAQDNRVSLQETENIYSNFKGDKMLKVYPEAGHDVFSPATREKWIKDVSEFLSDATGHS